MVLLVISGAVILSSTTGLAWRVIVQVMITSILLQAALIIDHINQVSLAVYIGLVVVSKG